MDAGTFGGILTVAAMLAFIGLVCWAYGKRRAADFDAMARLPLEDDASVQQQGRNNP